MRAWRVSDNQHSRFWGKRIVSRDTLKFQLVARRLSINNAPVLKLKFLSGVSHAQTIFRDYPPSSIATLGSHGSGNQDKIDSRFSQLDQWQTDLRISAEQHQHRVHWHPRRRQAETETRWF